MKLASVLSLLLVAWTNALPHVRLIGGADKPEPTYEISYQWKLFDEQTHFCGGAILSADWVVTAGHCVKDIENLGEFSVVVGNINDDTKKQERKVVKKVLHPDYEGNLGPYDIALLKLDSGLTLNDPIKALNLPDPTAKLPDSFTISGWGAKNDSLTSASILQKIENVPLLEISACNETVINLTGLNNLLNNVVNFCTSPQENTKSQGPCSGDSGDPLVQTVTTADGDKDVLFGIVSWSFSPCYTPNLPTVYTQISKVRDFIDETMNDPA